MVIQSSWLTVFFLSFNRNNYLQWLHEVRFWNSKKDKLYDVYSYDDFSSLFCLAGGMHYQVFQTLICCWWWLRVLDVDRALSLSRVWQFQVNQRKISFHTWPPPTTNNTSCRNQDTQSNSSHHLNFSLFTSYHWDTPQMIVQKLLSGQCCSKYVWGGYSVSFIQVAF